jgi:hypothetical protein
MREDEERRQREQQLQKEKYRGEKEAVLPQMYWDERERTNELYIETCGFVPTTRFVTVWECLPPIANFTQEESDLFEKQYLERPKQWGKVAEVIPKRDFKACIQFYYIKKKELDLKNKLKKQPKKKKKGRGKQRSSALVSELGNGENDTEEAQENGENGERRRPRRAAAPTFGGPEPPTTDSDNAAPVGTPGRRGAGTAKTDTAIEKVDGRKRRKPLAKDKESKLLRPNPTLAAAPPAAGAGRGRSRSNSKAQNTDLLAAQTGSPDPGRLPITYEHPPSIQPPVGPIQQTQVPGADRPGAGPASSMSDLMAPPALRPTPPPPAQPVMGAFPITQSLSQPAPERRLPTQASSYWSVSETNDFPALLRAFGTDWTTIATHMGSKTAVMVTSQQTLVMQPPNHQVLTT